MSLTNPIKVLCVLSLACASGSAGSDPEMPCFKPIFAELTCLHLVQASAICACCSAQPRCSFTMTRSNYFGKGKLLTIYRACACTCNWSHLGKKHVYSSATCIAQHSALSVLLCSAVTTARRRLHVLDARHPRIDCLKC